MQFVSMDLIGDVHPKSSAGKAYALTVICMLTGHIFCMSNKIKTASKLFKHILIMHILNVEDPVAFYQTIELS